MKKIAIIAPCVLPVPAAKGGAVEELITCILKQNEISKCFAIDLYTIADSSYSNTSYNHTNIIPISFSSIQLKIDKVSDKYYRTISNHNSKRLIDDVIIDTFLKYEQRLEEPYHAVIVQNVMSIAVRLLELKAGGRNYPIYFHMHNDVDTYRSPYYIKKLADAGVQFIAISDYIKSQILKYSDNKAVVHTLYNGVDFSKYSMSTRQQDGITKFLYAGRIIPAKGVLELVKSFTKLLDRYPGAKDITLDIIGFSEKPCRYEKDIIALAARTDGAISCISRLATADMAEKYNDYDAVIMPTMNEEPFGLVALETIAKGIPLITTNSGAIPEVVGEAAVIVDKNENLLDNLANAIEDFYINPKSRISLGKNGFYLARNRVEFNIDSYYHRLVSFLNNIEEQNNTVSVIVPVYNVENYVSRCVESLINQTYKNLEIILVDDESKDSSGLICDEYAKKDTRIKVIHQMNMGLSGARNSGLDAATGGYVFFVDSDDYIALDTIEKMHRHLLQCNADVVACGFAHVYDDRPEKVVTSPNPGMWSGRESVIQMMRTNNVCTVAWNKLYKRGLWESVRFPVGKVHEDEATTYKLLYTAKLVTYMPDPFYKYYQRSGSIMVASVVNRSTDFVDAIQNRINYFDSIGDIQLREHARITLLDHYKYVYRNAEDSQIKGEIINKYRKEIKQNKLPSICGFKKKLGQFIWQYYQY